MKKYFQILTIIAIVFSFSCSKHAGYQESKGGLLYKIFTEGKGQKGKIGDYAEVSASWRTTDGKIIVQPTHMFIRIDSFKKKGDPLEIYSLIGVGDSASMLIPADRLLPASVFASQDSIKKNDNLCIDIKIHKIYSAEDYAPIAEGLAPSPFGDEDKTIKNWLEEHKLTDRAKKTKSGLYYVIEKDGSGAQPAAGDQMTMNYTGALLDGTKFDSNVDPKFNHVSPFEFALGQGAVIKGWDEGVPLFHVGGKGKLIIPSRLGYGEHGAGANIPPNAILVFDIEILKAVKK